MEEKRKNIMESFIEGAKNGLNISLNTMLPALMFALIIMQVLELTGLIDVVGTVFKPIMVLLGLPGIAAPSLILSFVTTSGGIGIAVKLFIDGSIDSGQAAMLLTGCMLSGAALQYIGRVLGTADLKAKYYPLMIGVTIFNTVLGITLTRVLLMIFK